MEKPIFPSKYMRITQGYGEGTHKSSYAIDNADKDSGISDIYAPYTGIIKKIYQNDANEVWLESLDKVEYPDGTKDYMTILFAHNNDVSNLFVGKKINQNEAFYKEGTKGNASGNHCHIECGQGKFNGTGWHKNASGYYSINNGKKPEECLWIDDSINILDNNNYNWKKIEKAPDIIEKEEKPPVEDKEEPKVPEKDSDKKTEEDKETPKKFKYVCEKDDLYGIYLKKGETLYLE